MHHVIVGGVDVAQCRYKEDADILKKVYAYAGDRVEIKYMISVDVAFESNEAISFAASVLRQEADSHKTGHMDSVTKALYATSAQLQTAHDKEMT